MDMNELFTEKGMRDFTAERRDLHMNDANHYAQLADLVGRSLAQQEIAGDKFLSRRVRAWKVARHLKAMKRHSQKAAAASEALNAGYVNHVLELPQRRANAAQAKQDKLERRRTRPAVGSGQATANSLQQSLGYFSGDAVTSGVVQDQAPQYLDAQVYEYPMAAGAEGQGPRTVRDFFPRQDGRR